ncbi:MAG: bifunctional phosphoribosyl-AMP cyclohydrolase/phosphoribosyl-ATP diphosphatase HisIE [Bacteroidia bacterium]|nr:bifunctional phosphoribosyl-AMP cyclohydrolase/phosphoribosyl-ATP diphosphatase HisIE [Bacteroidia bacterium]
MNIDFSKSQDGLVPAIIQDAKTFKVLMLGYINEEALQKTIAEKKVTFYSRSKQRLWTKGETSGNFLYVEEIRADCDNDTLLIKVNPVGKVCHTGADTCFSEENITQDSLVNFLFELQNIIEHRKKELPDGSYTAKLFKEGVNKIAQKVGEEAIELIIEATAGKKELILEEAADLLYHLLVLLSAKDVTINEVINVLKKRHYKL